MKKFYSILSAIVIGGLVCAPQSLSQNRGRQNYGGGHRTEQRGAGSHSSSHDRKDHKDHKQDKDHKYDRDHKPNNGYRPGGNNHKPDHGYRPGNNDHKPDHGYRPGGNNHKPDHGYRPGNNGHKPDHGYRPNYGHKPDHNWRPPYYKRPPHIHGMYNHYYKWHRPVPPRGWVHHHGGPRLSTILGVTIGTALNLSLNALLNDGYTVTGYGPSSVYLTGVNQYGCYWPNATLNYINNSLRGSEFVYSTYGYNRARYDQMYRYMTNLYGVPVSSDINGDRVTATWWGYNNSYISLSYFPDYDSDGVYRYYTVLSVGK